MQKYSLKMLVEWQILEEKKSLEVGDHKKENI